MEYLQEPNISKYNIVIECFYKYYFVKTFDVFNYYNDDDNDLDDKIPGNVIIKKYYQYSDDIINNICNYCNNNKYEHYFKDIQKQYYFNSCKSSFTYYSPTQYNGVYQYYNDITYSREINLVDKIEKDYLTYFNIRSYYKPFIFPSLKKYMHTEEYKMINHYHKDFYDFNMFDVKQKINRINIDIYDNKCILSLDIGNVTLDNNMFEKINNDILFFTNKDNLNIILDKNYLKNILNNKIIKL